MLTDIILCQCSNHSDIYIYIFYMLRWLELRMRELSSLRHRLELQLASNPVSSAPLPVGTGEQAPAASALPIAVTGGNICATASENIAEGVSLSAGVSGEAAAPASAMAVAGGSSSEPDVAAGVSSRRIAQLSKLVADSVFFRSRLGRSTGEDSTHMAGGDEGGMAAASEGLPPRLSSSHPQDPASPALVHVACDLLSRQLHQLRNQLTYIFPTLERPPVPSGMKAARVGGGGGGGGALGSGGPLGGGVGRGGTHGGRIGGGGGGAAFRRTSSLVRGGGGGGGHWGGGHHGSLSVLTSGGGSFKRKRSDAAEPYEPLLSPTLRSADRTGLPPPVSDVDLSMYYREVHWDHHVVNTKTNLHFYCSSSCTANPVIPVPCP